MIGGVFLGTLLIVSIITVRISDMILDSRVGALDRTLGFLFGLGRGLIIVVVAFLFFAWLVPERKPARMGPRAPSRGWCCKAPATGCKSMLPEDPESTILKRLKKPKADDERRARRTALRPALGSPDVRRLASERPAGYRRSTAATCGS